VKLKPQLKGGPAGKLDDKIDKELPYHFPLDLSIGILDNPLPYRVWLSLIYRVKSKFYPKQRFRVDET